jgi:hypothetical protein
MGVARAASGPGGERSSFAEFMFAKAWAPHFCAPLAPSGGSMPFSTFGDNLLAGACLPVRTFFAYLFQQPLEVFIDSTKLTLHGLIQYFVKLSEKEKNRKLVDLLDTLEFNQVVIFVSKPQRAVELNRLLEEVNFPVMCIHGQMKQPDR